MEYQDINETIWTCRGTSTYDGITLWLADVALYRQSAQLFHQGWRSVP